MQAEAQPRASELILAGGERNHPPPLTMTTSIPRSRGRADVDPALEATKRSSTLGSDNGNLTYIITTRRMISELLNFETDCPCAEANKPGQLENLL